MIEDVNVCSLQSDTTCMQWQPITANICFLEFRVSQAILVTKYAECTLKRNNSDYSQQRKYLSITPKKRAFFCWASGREQETVLQVICFLQLSVNQWVSGFLNCRFSLHYYDCPKKGSEGLPALHWLAHTHAHIPDSPGLSLSARAIDLIRPIKDSA